MKKAKHMKGTKKSKKFLNLILIFLLIVIAASIYKIIGWSKNNKQTESITEKIANTIVEDNKENEKSYKVDFQQLKNLNSDTVAWIAVNGTDIKYPVVKSTDNKFYLSHSFDKSENGAGWIFADYRDKMDENDKNIILYGHNRKDGSMFATLKNILNKSWYENESNKKIIFVTEKGQHEYEVFAVYQIEKENYDTTINFKSDKQFENYIENAKNRSIYNFNVNVNSDDNILTLSTCANNNEYRIILHAVKIK